ncbi:hypothetical protein SF123566_0433, partial [Shigella flexneri 1235-66]
LGAAPCLVKLRQPAVMKKIRKTGQRRLSVRLRASSV